MAARLGCMVGLLELNARPQLDALIELDAAGQHELMDIVPSEQLTLLGLGVFKQLQENHLELWVGIKDPNMAEHGRWLFHTGLLTGKAGVMWFKCEPEDGTNLPDDQTNMTIALSNLIGRGLSTIEYLKQMRPNRELPTLAWLLKSRQVFDTTIANFVALMPENIDWATMHDLLHHPQAWREANGMVDMPHELLLRMHGLGALLDAPYGRNMLEARGCLDV